MDRTAFLGRFHRGADRDKRAAIKACSRSARSADPAQVCTVSDPPLHELVSLIARERVWSNESNRGPLCSGGAGLGGDFWNWLLELPEEDYPWTRAAQLREEFFRIAPDPE
ncbi:hypothetical protein [Panacagrimonas perspica]|uniref:hypothetical protein n=1 Tax=Panacagrimonas perspica TaxID=381431 RepID=UPI00105BAE61|nr:hypothetical protein [Panacagrimonas perspica]